jgi:hypothetical protein
MREERRSVLVRATARGLAEFVVIVVGVLVAFALDDWANRRADRNAEAAYLSALAADLRADSSVLVGAHIPNVERAQSVLARLGPIVHNSQPFPADTVALLKDIARSHIFILRVGARTTFDELLATGALRLLDQAELRAAVVAYYSFKDLADLRGELRASEYGDMVRGMVPESVASAPDVPLSEQALREFGMSRAAGMIRTSQFLEAMNRQRNYLAGTQTTLSDLLERAQLLLKRVDDRLMQL